MFFILNLTMLSFELFESNEERELSFCLLNLFILVWFDDLLSSFDAKFILFISNYENISILIIN